MQATLGRGPHYQRRLTLGIIAGVITLGVFTPVGPFLVEQTGKAFGYDVHAASLSFDFAGADIKQVSLEHQGASLRVARVHVHYKPLAIELDAPQLVLVHNKDGSWILPAHIPQFGSSTPSAKPKMNGQPQPFTMTAHVTNGRVDIVSPNNILAAGRHIRFDHITIALTPTFDGDATLIGGAQFSQASLQLQGRYRRSLGLTNAQISSPSLPLTALVDALAGSPAFYLDGGTADNLTAGIMSSALDGQTTQTSLYGSAQLKDGIVRVVGVSAPLKNVTGQLDIGNGGLSSQVLHGTLETAPFEVSGGLTNLAPLRLHVRGSLVGEAEDLHHAIQSIDTWPLTGHLHIGIDIAGPVTNPFLLARVDGQSVDWDQITLDQPHLDIALYGQALALLDGSAHTGNASAAMGGSLALGNKLDASLVGSAIGPAGSVETVVFLQEQGGAVQLFGDSNGIHFAGQGGLAPDRSNGWAIFSGIGPNGATGVGSFTAENNLYIGGGIAQHLPLPSAIADLHGSAVYAQYQQHMLLGGDIAAHGINPVFLTRFVPQIPRAFAFTDAQFHAIGDPRALDLQSVDVAGPNYDVHGQGIVGSEATSLTGNLQAHLTALAPQLQGVASGPFGIIADNKILYVAAPSLAIENGSIAGFPLGAVTAQAAVGRTTNFTLSASSGVGTIRAWGNPAGRIGISLENMHLAQAQAAGVNGAVDAVGWVQGQSGAAGVLVHHGDVHGIPAGGIGVVQRQGDQADLTDSALRLGTVLATAGGHLSWVSGTPSYDIFAKIRNAEIAPIVTHFVPQALAYEPEASMNADVAVHGTGDTPTVIGSVDVRQGSFSGYDIHNGHVEIVTNSSGLDMQNGKIDAGRSHLSFALGLHGSDQSALHVQATALDLGGLADALNPAMSAAGYGSVSMVAALQNGHLSSTGTINLSDVRFQDISLGQAFGHWNNENGWIAGHLGVQGPRTHVTVDGRVAPNLTEQYKLSPSSQVALKADVTNMDIVPRLALLGVHGPISGKLDGEAQLNGSIGSPSATVTAHLHDAMLMGMPILHATFDSAYRAGKIQLRKAELATADISAQVSGIVNRISLQSPIAFTVQISTPHLKDLIHHVTNKTVPVDGSVSTRLTIDGRLMKPHVLGAADFENGQIAGIPISEAVARYQFQGDSLQIGDAEVDLPTGRVTVAGNIPLTLSPFAIGPANAPLALQLGVSGVDLAGLLPSLPQKGQLVGQLNGAVALEGTPASPKLVGGLQLNNGSLTFHPETTVTALKADINFAGTSATFRANAGLGGGQLALFGDVDIPDLTDISSADSSTGISLTANAHQARIVVPGFGGGTFDGNLSLERDPSQVPELSGTVAVSNAVLPASSLMNVQTSPTAAPPTGLIAQTLLKVQMQIKQDVHVRSGAIDIGANGQALLGGSVANPTIAGTFNATSGTVTYLNRSFRLDRGTVVFNPSDGLQPYVDATATTVVTDPDTNTIRNASGQATITLAIRGRPDHLNVAFSSEPSYNQQQILGLLLNAGLVGAVDFNNASGPDAGTNGGLAQLNTGSSNSQQMSFQNEAVGLLGAQLTQGISPFTSTLGNAVGLSNLGVSVQSTGGVGLTASRKVGGNLSLFFEQSIGIPMRQSLGVDLNPNDSTALSLSVFQENDSVGVGRNNSLLYEPGHLEPTTAGASGQATSNGVSVSLKRRFQ